MAPAPTTQNGKSLTNVIVHDQATVTDSAEGNLKELIAQLNRAFDMVGMKDLISLINENDSLKKSLEDEKATRRVRDHEFRAEERSHEEKTEALEKLQEEVAQLKTTMQQERESASKKINEATKEHQKEKDRAVKAEKLYADQQTKIGKLETAISRAEALKKQVVDNESKANRRITELENELEGMEVHEKQLARFKSFGLQTAKVEMNASEFSQGLKEMFEFASRFLRELVFEREIDFATDSLDAWGLYKQNRVAAKLRIPLPDSNSLLAKQMRFASALAVLGRVLCDRIFQPVYSSNKNDWIMTSLRSMAENDETEREHHLRSMLLKISPEEHMKVGKERAKSAFEQAEPILRLIVAEEHTELLGDRLQKIFQVSVELWSKLQKAQEHVAPDLVLGSAEDWMPLTMPGGPKRQVSSNTSNRGNRTNSPSQGISRSQSTEAMQLGDDDAGPEVWPVFTAEDEVLCHGYYLKQQYIQEATREQREAEDAALKKNVRKMSRSNNGSTSKKNNNTASFLSRGGS